MHSPRSRPLFLRDFDGQCCSVVLPGISRMPHRTSFGSARSTLPARRSNGRWLVAGCRRSPASIRFGESRSTPGQRRRPIVQTVSPPSMVRSAGRNTAENTCHDVLGPNLPAGYMRFPGCWNARAFGRAPRNCARPTFGARRRSAEHTAHPHRGGGECEAPRQRSERPAQHSARPAPIARHDNPR